MPLHTRIEGEINFGKISVVVQVEPLKDSEDGVFSIETRGPQSTFWKTHYIPREKESPLSSEVKLYLYGHLVRFLSAHANAQELTIQVLKDKVDEFFNDNIDKFR